MWDPGWDLGQGESLGRASEVHTKARLGQLSGTSVDWLVMTNVLGHMRWSHQWKLGRRWTAPLHRRYNSL